MAEGVETHALAGVSPGGRVARKGQGDYFSPPLAADQFIALMGNR